MAFQFFIFFVFNLVSSNLKGINMIYLISVDTF